MSEVSKMINKMPKDIECPSCGAIFDIHLDRCPYCDSVNEYGDEEKYLKHLEDIKDNLENVQYIPENVYKDEAKSGMKKAVKVMIIILIILFGLSVAIFTVVKIVERKQLNEEIAQIKWEQENYPALDEMYANEDYEGLFAFWNTLYEDDGYKHYSIWTWKHYDFLSAYRDYATIKGYWDDIKEGKGQKGDYRYKYGFSDAVVLIYTPWDTKKDVAKTINERDYEQIMGYVEYAREFLHEVFHMSDEDIDNLKDEILMDYPGTGYDYAKIDKVFERIKDEV